jgi:hypothetical protein
MVLVKVHSYQCIFLAQAVFFLVPLIKRSIQIGKKQKAYLRHYATWMLNSYNVAEAGKRVQLLPLRTVVRFLSLQINLHT